MRNFICLFTFLWLISCQKTSNQQESEEIPTAGTSFSLDYDVLANKLVERMALDSGERVLLLSKPGSFDDMVAPLAEEIKKNNGVYIGALSVTDDQPNEWATEFVDNAFGADSIQLVRLLNTVDLGVMMPGPVPSDLAYGILQDILEEGNRRTIHFHWAGAYDMNGKTLEIDSAIDQFYQEAVLTTDYAKLAADQQRFEDAMSAKSIRVTTPEGTDINFEIGDRPVTKQDGNASSQRAAAGLNLIDREIEIPSGAIRVAPIEETVNGTIAFPDAVWGEQEVKGLIMTFEKGKLISFETASGREGVQKELSAAEGNSGKSFREFALGFNPKLAIPGENPWIPYYGYGSGIVRLSLGDNSELGGNVTGGYVRWNFFTNATVTVGGEIWVKDGELVN